MISKYFSREEFACECGCGFAAVDKELLDLLNLVRERFGRPITINSGCRCEKHNKKVGGKPESYHLKGMAADIVIGQVDPAIVFAFFDSVFPHKLGLGNYDTFTHVDSRSYKARW